ncbi:MAG: DoxX family protein [Bacteroidota bacterium]|nr:DoxX family protein [Bacteroidota bacterium]
MSDHKFQLAELLIRLFAGILFLFQGYDKLFKIKMKGVISSFTVDSDRQNIPRGMVALLAYYTSVTEFAGGILLMLGLFTNFTLYALGLDLLLVCFAFTYMQPIWDMKHVFPRFLLIVLLLLLPTSYNEFSLDALLDFN